MFESPIFLPNYGAKIGVKFYLCSASNRFLEMEDLLPLIEARTIKLSYYTPYNFVRPNAEQLEKQLEHGIIEPHTQFDENENNHIFEIEMEGKLHLFFVKFLAWDSDFFGTATFKLASILFDHQEVNVLAQAVEKFKIELQNFQYAAPKYLWMDIPCEDILVIQALTAQGFRHIENRLNYYKDDLQTIDYQRYEVRQATLKDIPKLEFVAKIMRNEYDRFHADSFFGREQAERFLAKYVAESVKGFADMVFVPNAPDLPPNGGFLTAKYFKEDWEKFGIKASRMPLFAVTPSCQGWGQKLVSEMTYHLREIGAEYAFIGTQSANRAVCRIMENLNYRLGSTSHILSYYFV